MSRINVKTLVLAFENRISALEKNPPDKVSDKTISLMLEAALEEEIRNHFKEVVKIRTKEELNKEFKKVGHKMIKEILKNIIADSSFRQELERNFKTLILNNFK